MSKLDRWQQILSEMSDEEFFRLDPDDYTDYDYDAIKAWYAENPDRPIIHRYAYQEKDAQWNTWAKYCHEAACRDNPIALAKYAYFCEHGIGCGQDMKTAIACYKRGAALGEVHCIRAMERLKEG